MQVLSENLCLEKFLLAAKKGETNLIVDYREHPISKHADFEKCIAQKIQEINKLGFNTWALSYHSRLIQFGIMDTKNEECKRIYAAKVEENIENMKNQVLQQMYRITPENIRNENPLMIALQGDQKEIHMPLFQPHFQELFRQSIQDASEYYFEFYTDGIEIYKR